MSDRDDLLNKIADVIDAHLPESAYEHGCQLSCGYSGDDLDIHLADAVLAVLPSGDGPLRETLCALADGWSQLPCVTGYRVPNDNGDDSQCLHCAAGDIRALLDGAS